MYILWYEPIKEKTSSNPLVKNEGVPLPWESNKGGVTNQVSDLGHVGYHSTSFNIPFRSGKSAMTSPPFSSGLSRIEFGGFPTAMFIEGSTKTLPFTTPATRAFHPSDDGVMLRLYWRARWRTVPERTKETCNSKGQTTWLGQVKHVKSLPPRINYRPSTPGLVLGLSIFVGPFWRYLDIRY